MNKSVGAKGGKTLVHTLLSHYWGFLASPSSFPSLLVSIYDTVIALAVPNVQEKITLGGRGARSPAAARINIVRFHTT